MTQASAYGSVIKNAVSIFLIKLFPALANVVVMVLYSRALPGEDYGHYQNFWVRLLFVSTICGLGIPATLLTYTAGKVKAYAAQLTKRQYQFYGVLLVLAAGIFASIEYSDIHMPWLLSAAVLALYTLYGIQESLLMVSRNFKTLAISNLLFAVWFIGVHLWVLHYGYSISLVFMLVGLGMAVRFAFLLISLRKMNNTTEAEELTDDAKAGMQKLWRHLGVYDVTQVVFRWIDKFIISLFLTAELSGIYFNGSQDVPFLPLLLGAVGSSVLVQLAEQKDARSKRNAYKLMYRSGKLLSCIVFPLFFFLLFFAQDIILLVFSDKFMEAIPVFIVAIMVLPLRAYNYTVILQHLHRGDIINRGAIMDLALACLLMYPMYNWFGLPGMALSFVISTYLQVAYYLFKTRALLRISIMELLPLGNWTWKFLLFGGLIYALHTLTYPHIGRLVFVITGVVVTGIIAATGFYLELKSSKEQKLTA